MEKLTIAHQTKYKFTILSTDIFIFYFFYKDIFGRSWRKSLTKNSSVPTFLRASHKINLDFFLPIDFKSYEKYSNIPTYDFNVIQLKSLILFICT